MAVTSIFLSSFSKAIQFKSPAIKLLPKRLSLGPTIIVLSPLLIFVTYNGKGDEIFVLDMGEPIKILELANIMIELTHSKTNIVYRELPKDDPTRRRPDITLAKERLGWTPNISLRDGLMKML